MERGMKYHAQTRTSLAHRCINKLQIVPIVPNVLRWSVNRQPENSKVQKVAFYYSNLRALKSTQLQECIEVHNIELTRLIDELIKQVLGAGQDVCHLAVRLYQKVIRIREQSLFYVLNFDSVVADVYGRALTSVDQLQYISRAHQR